MRFKTGDRVRIVRKVEFENDWRNNWYPPGMDKWVGLPDEYEVVKVTRGGVFFADLHSDFDVSDPRRFGWPHGALELAGPKQMELF